MSLARRRARLGVLCLTSSVALLVATSDAHAESAPLSVHVAVEASTSCTDEEKFWAEVTRRTAEIQRAPASADVPTLVVRAREEGKEIARGELFLRTARETVRSPRSVVARTCAEVTAALALALVLALEEGELTRPLPLPEPTLPPPSPPRSSPSAMKPSAVDHGSVRRRADIAMGAHSIVAGIDGLALGLGIFTEVRSHAEGRVSLRLEAAAWRRSVAREAGEAELTWLFLRARLCLIEALGVSFAVCGLVDGGAFTAAATQARSPLSYAGPWAGAGLALGATWAASRRLHIELEAGVLAPLVRDDLILEPNARMYSTPTVAMWVGIGPAFHF